MDPNVLRAQQWVNATYRDAPGYVACTENGRTGWETVDCLTQGLQHELGLSPTVKNFGPGTVDAVKRRGTLPGSETNKNIVSLYNHALWCKGYYADEGPGWGLVSAASLKQLAEDIGVTLDGSDRDMWARITRSLFRMDQFKQVPGGSITTRTVQKMLNSRYVSDLRIPAMNLVPCDGIYSRDVQQGLMMAIQFEIGLDKNTLNGYFGPGTQAALRRHTIRLGDSGNLARLFQAACYFNSPTYEDTTPRHFAEPVPGLLWSTFSQGDTDWLKKFQEFSQIEATGVGDYTTWAQLLVSCGDTTRDALGSDCITEITPARGKTLYDNGYRIVGRYLDEELPPDDPYYLGKALKPRELQTILAAGLRMYPLFQYNGTQLGNFTYAKGYAQAEKAHGKALEFGLNPGTCIYFAVDYDAMDSEIESNVIPYFLGVRARLAQLGSRYQFGVYGPRHVCDRVSREAGARWSFVSGMSWGYSGNLGYPLPMNWSFNQIREYEIQPGWGLDHNVWRKDKDLGVSSVGQDGRYDQITALITFVEGVERAYDDYPGLREPYDQPTQQYPKSAAQKLAYVLSFFRKDKYNHDQWPIAVGPVNPLFTKYVEEERGLVLQRDAITGAMDPVTYRPLDVQHTIAACQGHLRYFESGVDVTLGDGTGWLGDLITLYVEWRNSHSELNGTEFCKRYLANPHVASAYADDDWKADADAFNLARMLREDPALPLSGALRSYYFGGVRHRFNLFQRHRFGGSADTTALRVALAFATPAWDSIMSAGLLVLMRDLPAKELPWFIDSELLGQFIDSFATRLDQATREEPAL